ncbi:MAG: heavy metal-binding domain-containing protein [Candidatus Methylomirabilis sp.]|nr:heavy metal-binding domain-containing protein [Deltaproteobacteria bacterium]
MDELDRDIHELRSSITVVTSSSLPDRNIKGALGTVTGISETAASTDRGFRKAEKEALADIMRQGIKLGANAIVDLKMTTGSYEQQGSQWMVSKVVYYGTAVRV